MSKKIIFVGPPGAGKTTLRKIFFEGENSNKLLEYALEPTHGEESLILRLPGINQDVGIFDLAGQENERWLDTDEKAIFCDSKLILVVIDITTHFDDITAFIKKIINIRNNLTPSTIIYIFLHKIDLVSQKRIMDYKSIIKNEFSKEKLLSFLFTSLKKEYFTKTFSYFIDIMKICLHELISDEGLLFNMIDESLKVIHQIDNEVVLPKKGLSEKLNRPKKLINYLVESLVRKKHIEISNVEGKELLSLTEKGKTIYKDIFNKFSRNILANFGEESIISESSSEQKSPPFIGAFIADKDGRSLSKLELYENALEEFISNNVPTDGSIVPVELDLIPMFISALEKFSLELNIQDLTGFSLKGTNLRMHVFGFDDYTVTIFMNPDVNIKAIENKIKNYFKNLFDKYNTEFEKSVATGQIDNLYPAIDEGKKWLNELNDSYQSKVINSEIFDNKQAKDLYTKIDGLYDDISKQFSITLEKIKKLKVKSMKSILENNFEELKKIASIAEEIRAKYAI